MATPRRYATFQREQITDHTPDPNSLLRIWIVYVGQGDGILIQLPNKFSYDVLPDDEDQSRSERVDVLIDGGSFSGSNEDLMGNFLRRLYPGSSPIIEHAVISHHDSDHITALTRLINDGVASVETFYHSGLVSWQPGGHFPSPIPTGQKAVYKGSKSSPTRGMAYVTNQGSLLEDHLIDNRSEMQTALAGDDLHGIYEDLAEAVDRLAASDNSVEFRRCFVGSDFINEIEDDRRSAISDVRFELLWPQKPALPYKGTDWGNTINGNSVTFRLVYGDFAMLFTGDQNEKSQRTFLDDLIADNRTGAIDCDVYKVPHHGSKHFDPAFVDTLMNGLVLSVASMGPRGFGNSWRHPNPGLIKRLGRSHRFYSTYIHEKRFDTTDFKDAESLAELIETDRRTILIETDGDWFRLVEIPDSQNDLNMPPSVKSTHSGNGTRWINARHGG
ncbi:MAG: hypothetical protein JSV52_02255 [Candidatus Zixiibacteriota bacterium]|nr:MAG: hypothetical protein JSV52_02255 [candidate division Zixibacteria bacterium]